MYDESWCPQIGKLPCKNGNDWCETNSDLTRLFYRQQQIKIFPSGRNFIAGVLYGWGRIKIIIIHKSSTEESESECIHKTVNKEKYANNEAEHKETPVMDDPVVKDPRYFNIFKRVRNILNKLKAKCKRAWMATPRDKYYTELFRTMTYFNNWRNAPFSNKNIWDAIHRVIAEQESDANYITSYSHNLTVDTFSQTSNTQRENKNTILTSEKRYKLDALAETLNGLTVNDAGYYESDSANENDAKGNLASNPKITTHTSDRKKRKVTDNSNVYLQQKSLSKRTLPIITTTMDPHIDNRVATCGASPHMITMHQTT